MYPKVYPKVEFQQIYLFSSLKKYTVPTNLLTATFS